MSYLQLYLDGRQEILSYINQRNGLTKTHYYLSPEQRTKILRKLSDDQKHALHFSANYSHRSKIGNYLAKHKVTQEWEFYMIYDHGERTEYARCECGHLLRYEFVLKNRESGKLRSLGVDHFKQELGIPDEIADAINKNLHEINYDLDEILTKFINRWELPVHTRDIISEITMPEDIQYLLNANMPLLDRQLNKLTDLISHLILKEETTIRLERVYNSHNPDLPDKMTSNQIHEITQYLVKEIIPVCQSIKESRPSVTYIITEKYIQFKLFTEINLSRTRDKEGNILLRYNKDLLDNAWFLNKSYEYLISYGKRHPLIGCVARVDKLSNNHTGILIIFDTSTFGDLKNKAQKIIDGLKSNNIS